MKSTSMNHASIVSRLYTDFSFYRNLWSRQLDDTEELGALVFLPGKGLEWEWWTLSEIRQYIKDGGLDDEKILEGIYDFEFGEEFLVIVIEYVDGPRNQEVYFHRMSKVGMN